MQPSDGSGGSGRRGDPATRRVLKAGPLALRLLAAPASVALPPPAVPPLAASPPLPFVFSPRITLGRPRDVLARVPLGATRASKHGEAPAGAFSSDAFGDVAEEDPKSVGAALAAALAESLTTGGGLGGALGAAPPPPMGLHSRIQAAWAARAAWEERIFNACIAERSVALALLLNFPLPPPLPPPLPLPPFAMGGAVGAGAGGGAGFGAGAGAGAGLMVVGGSMRPPPPPSSWLGLLLRTQTSRVAGTRLLAAVSELVTTLGAASLGMTEGLGDGSGGGITPALATSPAPPLFSPLDIAVLCARRAQAQRLLLRTWRMAAEEAHCAAITGPLERQRAYLRAQLSELAVHRSGGFGGVPGVGGAGEWPPTSAALGVDEQQLQYQQHARTMAEVTDVGKRIQAAHAEGLRRSLLRSAAEAKARAARVATAKVRLPMRGPLMVDSSAPPSSLFVPLWDDAPNDIAHMIAASNKAVSGLISMPPLPSMMALGQSEAFGGTPSTAPLIPRSRVYAQSPEAFALLTELVAMFRTTGEVVGADLVRCKSQAPRVAVATAPKAFAATKSLKGRASGGAKGGASQVLGAEGDGEGGEGMEVGGGGEEDEEEEEEEDDVGSVRRMLQRQQQQQQQPKKASMAGTARLVGGGGVGSGTGEGGMIVATGSGGGGGGGASARVPSVRSLVAAVGGVPRVPTYVPGARFALAQARLVARSLAAEPEASVAPIISAVATPVLASSVLPTAVAVSAPLAVTRQQSGAVVSGAAVSTAPAVSSAPSSTTLSAHQRATASLLGMHVPPDTETRIARGAGVSPPSTLALGSSGGITIVQTSLAVASVRVDEHLAGPLPPPLAEDLASLKCRTGTLPAQTLAALEGIAATLASFPSHAGVGPSAARAQATSDIAAAENVRPDAAFVSLTSGPFSVAPLLAAHGYTLQCLPARSSGSISGSGLTCRLVSAVRGTPCLQNHRNISINSGSGPKNFSLMLIQCAACAHWLHWGCTGLPPETDPLAFSPSRSGAPARAIFRCAACCAPRLVCALENAVTTRRAFVRSRAAAGLFSLSLFHHCLNALGLGATLPPASAHADPTLRLLLATAAVLAGSRKNHAAVSAEADAVQASSSEMSVPRLNPSLIHAVTTDRALFSDEGLALVRCAHVTPLSSLTPHSSDAAALLDWSSTGSSAGAPGSADAAIWAARGGRAMSDGADGGLPSTSLYPAAEIVHLARHAWGSVRVLSLALISHQQHTSIRAEDATGIMTNPFAALLCRALGLQCSGPIASSSSSIARSRSVMGGAQATATVDAPPPVVPPTPEPVILESLPPLPAPAALTTSDAEAVAKAEAVAAVAAEAVAAVTAVAVMEPSDDVAMMEAQVLAVAATPAFTDDDQGASKRPRLDEVIAELTPPAPIAGPLDSFELEDVTSAVMGRPFGPSCSGLPYIPPPPRAVSRPKGRGIKATAASGAGGEVGSGSKGGRKTAFGAVAVATVRPRPPSTRAVPKGPPTVLPPSIFTPFSDDEDAPAAAAAAAAAAVAAAAVATSSSVAGAPAAVQGQASATAPAPPPAASLKKRVNEAASQKSVLLSKDTRARSSPKAPIPHPAAATAATATAASDAAATPMAGGFGTKATAPRSRLARTSVPSIPHPPASSSGGQPQGGSGTIPPPPLPTGNRKQMLASARALAAASKVSAAVVPITSPAVSAPAAPSPTPPSASPDALTDAVNSAPMRVGGGIFVKKGGIKRRRGGASLGGAAALAWKQGKESAAAAALLTSVNPPLSAEKGSIDAVPLRFSPFLGDPRGSQLMTAIPEELLGQAGIDGLAPLVLAATRVPSHDKGATVLPPSASALVATATSIGGNDLWLGGLCSAALRTLDRPVGVRDASASSSAPYSLAPEDEGVTAASLSSLLSGNNGDAAGGRLSLSGVWEAALSRAQTDTPPTSLLQALGFARPQDSQDTGAEAAGGMEPTAAHALLLSAARDLFSLLPQSEQHMWGNLAGLAWSAANPAYEFMAAATQLPPSFDAALKAARDAAEETSSAVIAHTRAVWPTISRGREGGIRPVVTTAVAARAVGEDDVLDPPLAGIAAPVALSLPHTSLSPHIVGSGTLINASLARSGCVPAPRVIQFGRYAGCSEWFLAWRVRSLLRLREARLAERLNGEAHIAAVLAAAADGDEDGGVGGGHAPARSLLHGDAPRNASSSAVAITGSAGWSAPARGSKASRSHSLPSSSGGGGGGGGVARRAFSSGAFRVGIQRPTSAASAPGSSSSDGALTSGNTNTLASSLPAEMRPWVLLPSLIDTQPSPEGASVAPILRDATHVSPTGTPLPCCAVSALVFGWASSVVPSSNSTPSPPTELIARLQSAAELSTHASLSSCGLQAPAVPAVNGTSCAPWGVLVCVDHFLPSLPLVELALPQPVFTLNDAEHAGSAHSHCALTCLRRAIFVAYRDACRRKRFAYSRVAERVCRIDQRLAAAVGVARALAALGSLPPSATTTPATVDAAGDGDFGEEPLSRLRVALRQASAIGLTGLESVNTIGGGSACMSLATACAARLALYSAPTAPTAESAFATALFRVLQRSTLVVPGVHRAKARLSPEEGGERVGVSTGEAEVGVREIIAVKPYVAPPAPKVSSLSKKRKGDDLTTSAAAAATAAPSPLLAASEAAEALPLSAAIIVAPKPAPRPVSAKRVRFGADASAPDAKPAAAPSAAPLVPELAAPFVSAIVAEFATSAATAPPATVSSLPEDKVPSMFAALAAADVTAAEVSVNSALAPPAHANPPIEGAAPSPPPPPASNKSSKKKYVRVDPCLKEEVRVTRLKPVSAAAAAAAASLSSVSGADGGGSSAHRTRVSSGAITRRPFAEGEEEEEEGSGNAVAAAASVLTGGAAIVRGSRAASRDADALPQQVQGNSRGGGGGERSARVGGVAVEGDKQTSDEVKAASSPTPAPLPIPTTASQAGMATGQVWNAWNTLHLSLALPAPSSERSISAPPAPSTLPTAVSPLSQQPPIAVPLLLNPYLAQATRSRILALPSPVPFPPAPTLKTASAAPLEVETPPALLSLCTGALTRTLSALTSTAASSTSMMDEDGRSNDDHDAAARLLLSRVHLLSGLPPKGWWVPPPGSDKPVVGGGGGAEGGVVTASGRIIRRMGADADDLKDPVARAIAAAAADSATSSADLPVVRLDPHAAPRARTTIDGTCLRPGCSVPALLFSKYCSSTCGMALAVARLAASLRFVATEAEGAAAVGAARASTMKSSAALVSVGIPAASATLAPPPAAGDVLYRHRSFRAAFVRFLETTVRNDVAPLASGVDAVAIERPLLGKGSKHRKMKAPLPAGDASAPPLLALGAVASSPSATIGGDGGLKPKADARARRAAAAASASVEIAAHLSRQLQALGASEQLSTILPHDLSVGEGSAAALAAPLVSSASPPSVPDVETLRRLVSLAKGANKKRTRGGAVGGESAAAAAAVAAVVAEDEVRARTIAACLGDVIFQSIGSEDAGGPVAFEGALLLGRNSGPLPSSPPGLKRVGGASKGGRPPKKGGGVNSDGSAIKLLKGGKGGGSSFVRSPHMHPEVGAAPTLPPSSDAAGESAALTAKRPRAASASGVAPGGGGGGSGAAPRARDVAADKERELALAAASRRILVAQGFVAPTLEEEKEAEEMMVSAAAAEDAARGVEGGAVQTESSRLHLPGGGWAQVLDPLLTTAAGLTRVSLFTARSSSQHTAACPTCGAAVRLGALFSAHVASRCGACGRLPGALSNARLAALSGGEGGASGAGAVAADLLPVAGASLAAAVASSKFRPIPGGRLAQTLALSRFVVPPSVVAAYDSTLTLRPRVSDRVHDVLARRWGGKSSALLSRCSFPTCLVPPTPNSSLRIEGNETSRWDAGADALLQLADARLASASSGGVATHPPSLEQACYDILCESATPSGSAGGGGGGCTNCSTARSECVAHAGWEVMLLDWADVRELNLTTAQSLPPGSR